MSATRPRVPVLSLPAPSQPQGQTTQDAADVQETGPNEKSTTPRTRQPPSSVVGSRRPLTSASRVGLHYASPPRFGPIGRSHQSAASGLPPTSASLTVTPRTPRAPLQRDGLPAAGSRPAPTKRKEADAEPPAASRLTRRVPAQPQRGTSGETRKPAVAAPQPSHLPSPRSPTRATPRTVSAAPKPTAAGGSRLAQPAATRDRSMPGTSSYAKRYDMSKTAAPKVVTRPNPSSSGTMWRPGGAPHRLQWDTRQLPHQRSAPRSPRDALTPTLPLGRAQSSLARDEARGGRNPAGLHQVPEDQAAEEAIGTEDKAVGTEESDTRSRPSHERAPEDVTLHERDEHDAPRAPAARTIETRSVACETIDGAKEKEVADQGTMAQAVMVAKAVQSEGSTEIVRTHDTPTQTIVAASCRRGAQTTLTAYRPEDTFPLAVFIHTEGQMLSRADSWPSLRCRTLISNPVVPPALPKDRTDLMDGHKMWVKSLEISKSASEVEKRDRALTRKRYTPSLWRREHHMTMALKAMVPRGKGAADRESEEKMLIRVLLKTLSSYVDASQQKQSELETVNESLSKKVKRLEAEKKELGERINDMSPRPSPRRGHSTVVEDSSRVPADHQPSSPRVHGRIVERRAAEPAKTEDIAELAKLREENRLLVVQQAEKDEYLKKITDMLASAPVSQRPSMPLPSSDRPDAPRPSIPRLPLDRLRSLNTNTDAPALNSPLSQASSSRRDVPLPGHASDLRLRFSPASSANYTPRSEFLGGGVGVGAEGSRSVCSEMPMQVRRWLADGSNINFSPEVRPNSPYTRRPGSLSARYPPSHPLLHTPLPAPLSHRSPRFGSCALFNEPLPLEKDFSPRSHDGRRDHFTPLTEEEREAISERLQGRTVKYAWGDKTEGEGEDDKGQERSAAEGGLSASHGGGGRRGVVMQRRTSSGLGGSPRTSIPEDSEVVALPSPSPFPAPAAAATDAQQPSPSYATNTSAQPSSPQVSRRGGHPTRNVRVRGLAGDTNFSSFSQLVGSFSRFDKIGVLYDPITHTCKGEGIVRLLSLADAQHVAHRIAQEHPHSSVVPYRVDFIDDKTFGRLMDQYSSS
ncbi:unnamed protein product [Vitrella brassicaformis CCMP3155]|uniref:Uncharacterized protein n=2 Tax=Vitrella brassicaformis TaxID=1169539 RepID=A0A0G4EWR0_VITBC|nr:unnamed protein product [Vitrella brassicaformis CCMP3155]|eukprot:CEM03188.1 unnamed protein product [Vitrella brassicaformis CCMP3155]